MKHFILILVLALVAYFLWQAAGPKERFAFLRFTSPHVLRVLAIVALVTAALVAAFYLPSTKLL